MDFDLAGVWNLWGFGLRVVPPVLLDGSLRESLFVLFPQEARGYKHVFPSPGEIFLFVFVNLQPHIFLPQLPND